MRLAFIIRRVIINQSNVCNWYGPLHLFTVTSLVAPLGFIPPKILWKCLTLKMNKQYICMFTSNDFKICNSSPITNGKSCGQQRIMRKNENLYSPQDFHLESQLYLSQVSHSSIYSSSLAQEDCSSSIYGTDVHSMNHYIKKLTLASCVLGTPLASICMYSSLYSKIQTLVTYLTHRSTDI